MNELKILNTLLLLTMIASFLMFSFYKHRVKRINSFVNFKDIKVDKKEKKSIFAIFKERLYMMLLLKNKQHLSNIIFNVYITTMFVMFLILLFTKNVILALTIPIVIHVFSSKLLKEMTIGFDVIVRKNFTILINHIVKVFSTTNDLGVVLYESSKKVEDPLRTLILTLSREIMIDNSDHRFIDFVENTDNLWLHSFILTLLNYKENSSKEHVINNLLALSEMIENRNEVSNKMINDRKPIVIMNYMLLVVGTLTFIANLVFNPMIKDFLFSFMGNVCLIAGIVAAFSTILINLKLVKY